MINHYLKFSLNFLRYVDVYLGIVKHTKQVVTIEEFVTGNFEKYVNNNGVFVQAQMTTCKRRQSGLVHFSYIKSNKKLMLADIQGAGHNLTDPEIASLTGVDNDEEQLLFCAGNCSQEALPTFLRHTSVMGSGQLGPLTNLAIMKPTRPKGI